MLAVLLSGYILAHSWYDQECCNDKDCFPVADEAVVELAPGKWQYLPTGNVFEGDRVKPSRDGHFHVCIGNSQWDMGKSYCIYIVQNS